jgi:hypothetical protein
VTFPELLEWQWRDYADKHRNRSNLLIHIVAVPVFLLSILALAIALASLSVLDGLFAVLLMGGSLFAQGQGHDLEGAPPTPFAGRIDAARRLIAEQFVTFPKFVWSGGWLRNLRSGSW